MIARVVWAWEEEGTVVVNNEAEVRPTILTLHRRAMINCGTLRRGELRPQPLKFTVQYSVARRPSLELPNDCRLLAKGTRPGLEPARNGFIFQLGKYRLMNHSVAA